MKDRRVKAAYRGEGRVGVQRVPVAGQAVDERLIAASHVGDFMVR